MQLTGLYVPDGTPSPPALPRPSGAQEVQLRATEDGKLVVSGTSGGGTGDASAANQTTQITLETAIRDRMPAALVAGALPIVARGGLTALGYQQITGLSSSTAMTVPSGATIAVVQAEGADVRWRDDGTAPTASVGMSLPAGAERIFDASLAAVRLIQTASGAVVNVSYYQ